MRYIVNSRFLTQKVTGVQRYAIEICRELKKLDPTFIFVSPKNILNREIANELGVLEIGSLTGHLWEQLDLPRYAAKINETKIINLCNTAPIFYKNKLVVLHDVAFERFPNNFSFKFRFLYRLIIPQILKRSQHILTDSEFSKNEISEIYNLNPNLIDCVPCAANHNFSNQKHRKREFFILAVSSLSPHKNFLSLIKAFKKANIPNLKLHIVGDVHKNFALADVIKSVKDNKNIVLMGRVTDEELIKLYSTALCFVYPSFYEGFGIPPLEAQACGCPCIVSNATSLPEVCGNSVLYCDPYSVDNIALKLDEMVGNIKLRSSLSAKGLENVKRFKWKDSALKIAKIIKKK